MMQCVIMVVSTLLATSPRAAFDRAVTDEGRVATGMVLLDDLLARQWSEGVCVDGAMLGLRDPDRTARAMSIVREALAVSAEIETAMHRQAAAGESVTAAGDRWRLMHGVASAADAVLRDDASLAADAAEWLGPIAGRDETGRGRRMLAMTHRTLDRHGLASSLAGEVVRDDSVAPLERASAMALLVRPDTDPAGFHAAMAQADDAWEVCLLAESAAAASDQPLRWIGPLRRELHRVGLSPLQAVDVASDIASRCDAAEASDDVDHAAMLGQARRAASEGDASVAEAWLDVGGDVWPSPLQGERWSCAAGLVEDPARRLELLAESAATGGPRSVSRWEAVGRHADAILQRDPRDPSGRAALARAASAGGVSPRWSRVLAGHEAMAGDVDAAVHRLAAIRPGGAEHLRAADQLAGLLEVRRMRSGGWSTEDATTLRAARSAAMAAARQRRDIERAEVARPIAARLSVTLVECLLDGGDAEAAEAILQEPDVTSWMADDDAARLEARRLAESGESEPLRRLLRRQDDVLKLLLCRTLLSASTEWPDRVRSTIVDVLVQVTPAGPVDARLAVADALRAAGRCSVAVNWYESILVSDPSLLEAVLGRAECLRVSEDREVLAIAADGFRRIAALPRDDDPSRWRHANLRLLDVLRRAGVDDRRLAARLERLRTIDPGISGR